MIDPPSFDRCLSLLRYEFPAPELIASFKYHAGFAEGDALACLLADQINVLSHEPRPALLIPVPLHRRRLQERGYNQSMELARRVGKRCAIPVDASSCIRIRATPPQKGLAALQRHRNLKAAFQLTDSRNVRNARHVAIIDDVVTTMTTVNELARLLRSAGVQRIDVYCLARVT